MPREDLATSTRIASVAGGRDAPNPVSLEQTHAQAGTLVEPGHAFLDFFVRYRRNTKDMTDRSLVAITLNHLNEVISKLRFNHR